MFKQISLGIGLAVLAVGSASAHVVFNEDETQAGSFFTAELRVMHGCDGQPTDTVRITIPDGVTRVTPRMISGWEVSVETRKLETPILLHGFAVDEVVDALLWTGGSFPDFSFEQFEFRAMMPDEPGRRLDFTVRQSCGDLNLNWDDIAADDDDPWTLDEPAPFIRLIPQPSD